MARVVVAGAGAIGASIALPPRAARSRRRRARRRGGDRGRCHRQGDGRRPPAVHDRGGGAARTRERAALPGARARRSSSRSGTSSSPRPRRAWPSSKNGGWRRRCSASPSRASIRRSCDGLRVDDVLGATICREDGIADPVGVTRELVRRAAERGVVVREETDALALDADLLVVACGAASRAVAATRGVELPVRPLVRQLVDVGPVQGLPLDLPMTIEESASTSDGSALTACGWRWSSPSCAGMARRTCATTSSRTGARGSPPLPVRRRRPDPARLGRLLRHDPGRASDHRPRRRRRLRGVRLLRARLHAVPRGRRRGRGRAARRRRRRSTSRTTGWSASRAARSFRRRSCSEPAYSNASPRRERSSSRYRPSTVASRSNSSSRSGPFPISSRAPLGKGWSAASRDSNR